MGLLRHHISWSAVGAKHPEELAADDAPRAENWRMSLFCNATDTLCVRSASLESFGRRSGQGRPPRPETNFLHLHILQQTKQRQNRENRNTPRIRTENFRKRKQSKQKQYIVATASLCFSVASGMNECHNNDASVQIPSSKMRAVTAHCEFDPSLPTHSLRCHGLLELQRLA